ncbi:MAG: hypothetical protein H6815_06510 [Phycisphaeraceae bacterium]|nr:hypothetical protein [Phycisphaerales bacterium]MCB9860090.1 hypothetical protein [Phycisphaeraceae bacterium]
MNPRKPREHTGEYERASRFVLAEFAGRHAFERSNMLPAVAGAMAGGSGVIGKLFVDRPVAEAAAGSEASQRALDAIEHTQRRLDNLRNLVDRFGIEPPGGDGPRVA